MTVLRMFGRGRSQETGGREQKEIADRVPPGQKVVTRWPVMHAGRVPSFDAETWIFRIFGLVSQELVLTWEEFSSLPMITSTSDVHCVTGWTRLDNEWEGVAGRTVAGLTEPMAEARFVMVYGEHGYTANIPIELLCDDEVLFALKHNGKELAPQHGYPVRLVVPQRYFWKSVKWVRGLEFMEEDRKGYWEERGYHNEGDPWNEQRYSFGARSPSE